MLTFTWLDVIAIFAAFRLIFRQSFSGYAAIAADAATPFRACLLHFRWFDVAFMLC